MCRVFTYVNIRMIPRYSNAGVSVGLHEEVIITGHQILQCVTLNMAGHKNRWIKKEKKFNILHSFKVTHK